MDKTLKAEIPSFKGKKLATVTALFWGMVLAGALYRNATVARDPLIYMIPNFLLLTPFRGATAWCWKKFLRYGNQEIAPIPIPELQASNYSYENMKYITDDFKHPGIVRGLFKDTVGVKMWHKSGYLEQFIGNFSIPTIQRATYGTDQQDRVNMLFKDSWNEIVNDKNSMKYLFFPVKSRIGMNGTAEGRAQLLKDTITELTHRDLDLDRIWEGFGNEHHKTYGGAQFIAGQGQGGKTGTHWHCAPGSNWFIQVHGKKRWYMLDQEYSAYMQPKRNGLFTMWTGAGMEMTELEKYLPIKYTDIEAGDMLYNPGWEWHTIHNYDGLSIGLPIRESNATLNIRNNLHYTIYAAINGIADKFGISYALDKSY